MIEALNLSHFLSYTHFFNTPSGNKTINNLTQFKLVSASIQYIIGPHMI